MCCGNKEYAPDKCCLLPEIINSALASATKRRNFNKYVNVSGYPIGVAYNATKDKYYARDAVQINVAQHLYLKRRNCIG